MKNKKVIITVVGILVILSLSIFIFKDKREANNLDDKIQQIEERENSRQINQMKGNADKIEGVEDEVIKIDVTESALDDDLDELENLEF